MKTNPPSPARESASEHIHLRSTKPRKGAYVHAAMANGETLAAWMFRVCDEATHGNALVTALKTWIIFAEDELSPFDEPCEAEDEQDMCPKCKNTGCIWLKIKAARDAVAAAAAGFAPRKDGQ